MTYDVSLGRVIKKEMIMYKKTSVVIQLVIALSLVSCGGSGSGSGNSKKTTVKKDKKIVVTKKKEIKDFSNMSLAQGALVVKRLNSALVLAVKQKKLIKPIIAKYVKADDFECVLHDKSENIELYSIPGTSQKSGEPLPGLLVVSSAPLKTYAREPKTKEEAEKRTKDDCKNRLPDSGCLLSLRLNKSGLYKLAGSMSMINTNTLNRGSISWHKLKSGQNLLKVTQDSEVIGCDEEDGDSSTTSKNITFKCYVGGQFIQLQSFMVVYNKTNSYSSGTKYEFEWITVGNNDFLKVADTVHSSMNTGGRFSEESTTTTKIYLVGKQCKKMKVLTKNQLISLRKLDKKGMIPPPGKMVVEEKDEGYNEGTGYDNSENYEN
jgi:hypothetical protein